jgi:opacity protein-like surface antigen
MRVLRLVPLVSGVVALWWMGGPGAAFAEEEDDFGRTGVYIGLGGSLTHLLDAEEALEDELSSSVSVDTSTKENFGINGRIGYRFHSHFAAEFEGEWHGPFDGKHKVGNVEFAMSEVETLVFTANAKGYLFKDRFQPYAVLGAGVMGSFHNIQYAAGGESYERSTGFAARFGGGADLYITEHIVLNAEIRYVLPTGAVEGLDMISFGWAVQYRF